MILSILGAAMQARVHLRRLALSHEIAWRRQGHILAQLIQQAKPTAFGRAYNFDSIHSYDEYRQRVPIRRHEDFWREWWGPSFPVLNNVTWPGHIPYFAMTSGTSGGRTRYVPVSQEMIMSNQIAGLTLLGWHFLHYPNSAALRGKSLMVGGSTQLDVLRPGVRAGDLSGIAAFTLPWYAAPMVYPSRDISLLADWRQKLDLIVSGAAGERITVLSGTPSWVLILLDSLKQKGSVLPELSLLVHGGVNFDPYRSLFEDRLGSRPDLDYREVYPASEGFIASADRGPGQGLRLHLDTGLFYEFVPLAEIDDSMPQALALNEVKCGPVYALVLTTCAGLWRYVIGDLVKFISLDPPRILIAGRLSTMLSAFGEQLTGQQIEQALAQAAAQQGAGIMDFTVGAIFPKHQGEVGHHRYYIEAGRNLDRVIFAQTLDEMLCRTNDGYEIHRADGFGMGMPEIVLLRSGAFAAWMGSRGKAGGQNKVPRVLRDPLWSELQTFMKNWRLD